MFKLNLVTAGLATLCLAGCGASGQSAHPPAPVPPALSSAEAPYDAQFLDILIDRDEQRIKTAGAAFELSTNAKVKSMATLLIKNDRTELEQLKAWRKEWFPTVARLEPKPTETPSDAGGDDAFVRLMVKQDESAREMASSAPQRAEHTDLKNFAITLETGRAREIDRLNNLQRELGVTPTPMKSTSDDDSPMFVHRLR